MDERHVGPAAQQLTIAGPFNVTDKRLNFGIGEKAVFLPSNNVPEDEITVSEAPSLRSAHIVMVGVPAEIAVAISIASFIIGAALTGMLCCIHHRKAMPKSVRRIILKCCAHFLDKSLQAQNPMLENVGTAAAACPESQAMLPPPNGVTQPAAAEASLQQHHYPKLDMTAC